MIECHLERLHSAHGQSGHGAVIAIGKGAKCLIDKGNQRLGHIVFESAHPLLHDFDEVRPAKRLAGEVRHHVPDASSHSHWP